jgi:hypothetical protein
MRPRARLAAAARAEPLDFDLVAEDREVGGAGRLLFEVGGHPDRQVVDAAATEAADVIVPLDVAVETRGPGNSANLPDGAFRREAFEIAVDGAEAEARKLSAGLRVNPGGRRVVHGGAHHRQNDRPLL